MIKPEHTVTILVILVVIAIMAVVGNGDYEEAKREEAFYCRMVATGQWPDYKGVYALCAPLDLLKSPKTTETKHPGQQDHKRLIVDRR